MMQLSWDALEQQNAVTNALRQLSIEELSQHKLLALACSRGLVRPEHVAPARLRLLENMRRQAVAQSLLEEIGSRADSLSIGLLKGSALWGDIYRPGEREASDLDVFVHPNEQEALIVILRSIGFGEIHTSSSKLSGFKTLCLSDRFGDLSVEIHTKLWWREPKGFEWQWRPALRSPFLRLSLEDQLIHLCGHWIAQHTMISMHWLFDILLFLEKYGREINVEKLHARAKELRLSRSVLLASELCAKLTEPSGFAALTGSRVDRKFLTNPKQNPLRYFWIKHSVQESWRDALTYDFHWLAERWSN